jgi:hypothetical protein
VLAVSEGNYPINETLRIETEAAVAASKLDLSTPT